MYYLSHMQAAREIGPIFVAYNGPCMGAVCRLILFPTLGPPAGGCLV